MIKWTSEAHNIEYVSLRYFNVAGASLDSSLGERHNPETHLIPNVLRSTPDNPVKIFGIQNKGFIKEGFDADFTIIDLKKNMLSNLFFYGVLDL